MTYPNARGPVAPASREALRRELTSGFRRALGLTALGTVVPGAGLTQTRSRRAGWLLLAVAILTLGAGAYYVLRTGVTNAALSVVARPNVLQALAIAFAVGGILWCGSIILTAVQARPTRLDRARTRALAAFTTLMVFAVAAGSFKAAEYATITQGTVAAVFGGGGPAPKPGQGAQIAEGDDPWAEQARVNVLLLGSDAGVGRIGTRTDSMVVASIDTKSGRTTLVSLPRNLERAPLPKNSPLRNEYPSGVFGRPTCATGPHECLLNAIWAEADAYKLNHPGSYQGKQSAGRGEIRDVIQEIIGLKIDHTVVIDLKGFEELIDTMGGVDMTVKPSGTGLPLPIGGHSDGHGGVIGEKGFFKLGRQHLTGNLALWYARTRAADDDNFRQQRQRCVIKAVVQQVNPAKMLGEYPHLAEIAKENIYTDIPAQNLPAFVDLVERVQKSTISSVALGPKQGISSVNPDYEKIRELVSEGIKPAPAKPKPSSTSTSTSTKAPTRPATTTAPVDECA
jgi:LCP family protein required for cell wall assembly